MSELYHAAARDPRRARRVATRRSSASAPRSITTSCCRRSPRSRSRASTTARRAVARRLPRLRHASLGRWRRPVLRAASRPTAPRAFRRHRARRRHGLEARACRSRTSAAATQRSCHSTVRPPDRSGSTRASFSSSRRSGRASRRSCSTGSIARARRSGSIAFVPPGRCAITTALSGYLGDVRAAAGSRRRHARRRCPARRARGPRPRRDRGHRRGDRRCFMPAIASIRASLARARSKALTRTRSSSPTSSRRACLRCRSWMRRPRAGISLSHRLSRVRAMVVFSNHRLGASAELLVSDDVAAIDPARDRRRSPARSPRRGGSSSSCCGSTAAPSTRPTVLDVTDIAWTPDHFEPQRRFLLDAILRAAAQADHALAFDRWRRMIEAHPADSVQVGQALAVAANRLIYQRDSY